MDHTAQEHFYGGLRKLGLSWLLPPFTSCSKWVAYHQTVPLAWHYALVDKSSSTNPQQRLTEQQGTDRHERNAVVSLLRFVNQLQLSQTSSES